MVRNFMIMLIILLSCGAGYSAVEYLNECGKSSDWVNGTTYYLNFTVIPNTYNSASCFTINDDISNIVFIGNGEKITIQETDLENLFYNTNAVNWDGIQFKNIEIEDLTRTKSFFFLKLYRTTYLNSSFVDLFFENLSINIDNYYNNSLIFYKETYTTNELALTNFDNLFINECYLINAQLIKSEQTITSTPTRKMLTFRNSVFSNIFLDLDLDDSEIISRSYAIFSFFNLQPSDYKVLNLSNININNIVVKKSKNKLQLSNYYFYLVLANTIISNVSLTDSIIQGYIYTDSNNNNYDDNNTIDTIYSDFTKTNNKMYVDIRGIRYMQDLNEGQPFLSSTYKNMPINDESIGSPITITMNDVNIDSSYTEIEVNNFQGLVLNSNSKLICENSFCSYYDNFTNILQKKFRGMFEVSGNNIISGIVFDKFFENNANIIANKNDVYINNISITDNIYNLGWSFASYDELTSREAIKLKGNNILIDNNIFTLIDAVYDEDMSILYIDSINPTSNIISNNLFQNNALNQENQIFTNKCEAVFTHNSIESGINISNTCDDVIANSLYAYPYNNKIYYFNTGNYYEDNTGCTDSNSDDICDNPYTSGLITDDYPLVSYPYDFESNLLHAVSVVEADEDFNILLLGVINGNTYNLQDETSLLTIGFNQDSDYPDLICDYILDGASIESQTVVNPVKNQVYNITVNNWQQKQYSYRIECYNDFVFKFSNEIIFNINLASVEGGEEDNGVNNTYTGTPNIITDDIGTTSDNIVNFFAGLSGGVMSMIIPIGIFMFVMLIIGGVLLFIGGGGK